MGMVGTLKNYKKMNGKIYGIYVQKQLINLGIW